MAENGAFTPALLDSTDSARHHNRRLGCSVPNLGETLGQRRETMYNPDSARLRYDRRHARCEKYGDMTIHPHSSDESMQMATEVLANSMVGCKINTVLVSLFSLANKQYAP
eukprot:TRINITY_DN113750_c0_g1_i1.p3 TRINITY_DN113750_c0_g1~~TRINITY_DN113750_c0_g1_i1.p3  ORF type:complete len:111 (+),score=7.14 TRINITY_DN113750_c0_g1_i1:414-746(+)